MTVRTAVARTQRVARFEGGGRIEWRERPVPEPSTGELLLRVRASALCGTDRALLASGWPVTPGHEIAGEVVAAGDGTTSSEGTAGVVYLMALCGDCRQCRAGATNQCLAKRGDIGFSRDGGHARFVLVPEESFVPVDADIHPTEATLLLDVMSTTAHALRRARAVRDDIRSLLIAGAGPVGLGLAAVARLQFGPSVPIVVTDVAPYRLRLAARLGASVVDLSQHSMPAALRALGLDMDVDVAFDTSGRETARRGLLDALGRRGVLVCIGHGEGLSVSVTTQLIAPERTIMGSEYFRLDELPEALDVLRRNREYLAQIVTHRYRMEQLEEAYELFLSGESGKVVIEP